MATRDLFWHKITPSNELSFLQSADFYYHAFTKHLVANPQFVVKPFSNSGRNTKTEWELKIVLFYGGYLEKKLFSKKLYSETKTAEW